ncbi:MAG: hypothetical protein K5760_08100 [Clostridium sp.]|nr:hypothetical protein [Clostridium sp.]
MIKTENEIENTPAGNDMYPLYWTTCKEGIFCGRVFYAAGILCGGYFMRPGISLRSEGFFSGVRRIKECLFMGELIIFFDDCSGRIIRNHGFCGKTDSNHERTKKQILMMDNMIE